MVDKIIMKKSGEIKSIEKMSSGNILPHGVKRLMNKVTRFPNDRNAGPPFFFGPRGVNLPKSD
jgi:hypothetical protein